MSEATETTALATTEERGLRLSGPRLPYHPALEERYGIDRGSWKVLCEAFYPMAEGPESIIMAVSYCKARNLDIMKKPVHIVPVWDKKRGKMVDTVWPAISETRITAMRTQAYAGKDETVFGPEIKATLGGVEVVYPEWASVTVYRFVQGVRCAFTGERVRWVEYYAKAKKDTLAPNDMWRVKAYSQLSKCAEASALRCAFPEEDSGPTAEEMDGQEVESTLAPEPVTGSGVMARLQGADTATGLDRGHVERETAALPAPDGDTPVERVRAKRAARKQAAEDPTLPEAATATEAAPPAESEPASSESAEPAAEPSLDPSDSGQPGTDEPTQDGEPEQAEEETTEAVEVEAQEEEAEAVPAALATLIDATEGADSWQAVKDAMGAFQKTDLWPTLSEDQQNHIRASTWETLVDRKNSPKGDDPAIDWLPDHHHDLSAFRLWLEAEDNPVEIKAALALLQADVAVQAKTAALASVTAAAAARIAALGA